MKENGINKLLDLLNEYAKVLGIGNHIGWHNRKTVENSDFIFYKKFGFIERLVNNNKIDFDKLSKKEIESRVSIVMRGMFIETNWLLMLLSIQDNPISFLTSILR